MTHETAELDVRWIAESIPDNVMLLDRDGRIQYVNYTPRYMSRDQIVGSVIWAYVDPLDEPIIRACFARVLETGRPERYGTQYVAPNGAVSDWESRVAPAVRHGEITGFIVVSINLTERIQQATEREHLENAVRRSRQTDAAGKLAAHDFDHLLHAIEANARLVEHRATDPGIAGYAQQIKAAVQSGIALTQRLRAGSQSDVDDPADEPSASATAPFGSGAASSFGSGAAVSPGIDIADTADADAALESPAAASETILVAEDNELVRRVLVHLLDEAGYQVVTAADGFEAVRAGSDRDAPVSLAILDILLPGMTGPLVARELAATHPHMKFMFVSGYSEGSHLEQSGIASAAILRKPFTQQQLLDRLRELLAR